MKISAIISILFGLFLLIVTTNLFLNLPNCKDDTDVLLYILLIICSGFSGVGFIISGIIDYYKANKNEKDNNIRY